MIKSYKIPILTGRIKIIQTRDFKKIQKKYDLMDIDGFGAFVFSDYKKSKGFVCVATFAKDTTPGIIAHECMHVVSKIFDFHCIEFDTKNDEFQCYLLEWLTKKCFKCLKIK